eukprot:CAMPEP_0185550226 /NCGR_PEP_ID=MMETSP1381-20130426/19817_1 /TAXON_ID=298111 /ORGANISM="Pavlova sp., Strain CCMP459" /LENGTH=221 /DNA_ID=CAMNT_0028162999 /DNA_START=38 /DNA_END=704 /DNA_ORIENTATION=-
MRFVVLALVLATIPAGWAWTSSHAPMAPRHQTAIARARPTLLGPDPVELWSSFRGALENVGATVVFERGALRILDPDLAAFVGGAVGVIGTLESIQARRRAVRERLTCVYCDGQGTLACGVCYGSGVTSDGQPCPNCSGTGKVSCVSCQGSGNSVLLAEDRNLIRELAGLGTMQDELEQEIAGRQLLAGGACDDQDVHESIERAREIVWRPPNDGCPVLLE